MYVLLLPLIYIAFISLGLPDPILGSAWPLMYPQLRVPISYAGILTMLIALGTIASSLMSDTVAKRLGTPIIVCLSVLMTSIGLFGFSIAKSFYLLTIFCIPYGLGAGAIDVALNNYVAIHYKTCHMSWLHCFWGVGAMLGPMVMSWCLVNKATWQCGYKYIAIIQIVLTIILFASIPIWKKSHPQKDGNKQKTLSLAQVIKIKGVKLVLCAFFAYSALETTTGLWASSYLVNFRGISPEIAAKYASLFLIGITGGRFICGFIAEKIGDKNLIIIGTLVSMCGIIAVGIHTKSSDAALIGLVVIGLGLSPIYPSIIHSTPFNFGKENSQAIIGIQMSSAYIGTIFAPPLFGLIANHLSIGLFPIYLMIFAIIVLLTSISLFRIARKSQVFI